MESKTRGGTLVNKSNWYSRSMAGPFSRRIQHFGSDNVWNLQISSSFSSHKLRLIKSRVSEIVEARGRTENSMIIPQLFDAVIQLIDELWVSVLPLKGSVENLLNHKESMCYIVSSVV